ncbi:glycoside hydrolase family 57 protein [Saccharopolyspora erythraea]|uniref:1,4-alpha-glucan branching protein domain-containing protein n=1 Tax=Saccharopolyspora erythraea TaxID=1836 RepID=UPI001BA6B5C1|nr:glycoside hydrolase family 57 protein [Saccharopolyspora erythraea]QUH04624.1 glycoside hydrolase family 57 protein [Saccharopolyspora erythraea]
MNEPVGDFALVLHSHLPWLAGHGRWPVGEEWLYQAWAASYLPVAGMLERLAAEGHRDVLTFGLTPVLAAQLDDPHCLRGFHHWLGNWRLRAEEAAARWRGSGDELAATECRAASRALEEFELRWRHGASPVLRPLVDTGVVELIGGPATHPFQPLLDPRMREFALRLGLADTRLRLGSAPEGIWAPECAYGPGVEREYATTGVRRFLVDGSALDDVSAAHTVGCTDIVCFGRDVSISDLVWSDGGYPSHPAYRDFHTFDHAVGLKPSRITGKDVAPEDKQPYALGPAAAVADEHADDFVAAVRQRLEEHRERAGRPGLVVAAFDTELFGHWWFEGPRWLERVLRTLPDAGVRVTTLRGALAVGHLGEPVELPETSWGVGGDWRVWAGEPVADIAAANQRLQERVLRRAPRAGAARDHVLDQLLRETVLALASDWAFMVTHDAGAGYARERAHDHGSRAHRLLDLLESGRYAEADALARELRGRDGVFGHLDARLLPR